MRLWGRSPLAIAIIMIAAQPADAMVAYRRPHSHRNLYFGVFGSGLESYGFERDERSGVLGGGLFVAFEMSGGWPTPWSTGRQDLNWSFDGRARHLTSYDNDRERTSMPIDLVIRISHLNYPRTENYIDRSGWPTAVYEAGSTVPYVGAGVTLDVPLAGTGGTHVGVVAVAGVERWLAKHIGVYAEVELRGMILDGSVMQAGANAGVLLAF